MIEKKMSEREMRRQLDRYVNGRLSTPEVDRLWAEILQEPAWLEELEADAAARLLMDVKRSNSGDTKRENRPAATVENGGLAAGTRRLSLRWMAAAAITTVLIVSLYLLSTAPSQEIPDRIEWSEMVAPDIYRDNQRGYDEIDVWINEGLALALRERPDEAIETYNEMLRKELTGVQLDAVRLNLAILYYNDGAYHQAEAQLDRFVNEPHEARPERLSGKAWWIYGLAQRQSGRIEEANDSFRRALQVDQVHRDRIEGWIEPVE